MMRSPYAAAVLTMAALALTGVVAPAANAQSVVYVSQIADSPARAVRLSPAPPATRGNEATIVQRGDANGATVAQQGGANVAIISQHGNGNVANTLQTSYIGAGANTLVVSQTGDSNRAAIGQQGGDNNLALTQTGAKEATISQNGNSTVSVAQLGHGPDSIDVTTDPGASVSITRYAGMAQAGR